MKIKLIMASASKELYEELYESRMELAQNDVEIVSVQPKQGFGSLESAYDEALTVPYIIQEATLAEKEGFDAVVLDCAADPGLRAIKEKLTIPVVGSGEASYLTAMTVSAKFSIIAVLEQSVRLMEENIQKYGFSSRLASVRSADVPVLDLKNHEAALEAICRTAKKAIEEDGAQSIVLGCTGMKKLCAEVEKELGVPVIEPLSCAVQMAAGLVRMQLKTSKAAYPEPIEKDWLSYINKSYRYDRR